ncbi:MAG: N-acetylmuramoyl-L-alanine amidase [Treponema sp.]|nr:N-acetylmuramoyl-L-alanine amidase [Treponema sp.]
MEKYRIIKSLIFLWVLLFLPIQLFTQNTRFTAAGASSRVFSLEQTLNTLYSLDNRGEKEFRWDPFLQEGLFNIGGHYGIFSTSLQAGRNGFLMINNREIFSVPLPYIERGELVFPEPFVTTTHDAFARSISEDTSNLRIAAIIIDPGHGGRDSGAVREHTINGRRQTVAEKDIALNASLMLRDMLVRAYPDKRIVMTRERDTYMSLEERTAIANAVPIRRNEAIIYISIHANAVNYTSARGYEVWYLSPEQRRTLLDESHFPDSPELRQIMNTITEEAFTIESMKIAQSILDSLKSTMGNALPSRGIKAENYFVVRRSHMPAVLVELGFVSNREDAILMTSNVHLRRMVEAVYKGIADFVSDFEQSGGFITQR